MRFILLSFFIVSVTAGLAQSPTNNSDTVRIQINIKNIKHDRAQVTIYPVKTTRDTLIYNMPKIVPGTYSISNFGRFVNNVVAYDVSGDALPVMQIDTNRWAVADASRLDHISYWVDDTYDYPGSDIFEPGGTEITAGKSVMLNAFGFVGYFDGMKDIPYLFQVIRPEKFYGETSLERISSRDTLDTFAAKNYFTIHDCPILYCVPDTASMQIGDTRIGVAVYSPKNVVTSQEVLNTVRDLFLATAKYLGGTLPVKRYSILVYLANGSTPSGQMGALEHNSSTTFVLPNAPIAALSQTIRDVTAHEFMHIVTPLSIHSYEIGDFDFMDPKMSQNLWFYEGCTEYAAHHIQVKEGLITLEEFLKVMRDKMISAQTFDESIPFTEMSKNVLGKYKDQYGNVYEKGALIGMALDLKLRKLSEGKYGLQNLKRDLSKVYGPDSSFVDTTLFSEMGRVSGYPEITTFLRKYVGGNTPLPFQELLNYAGIMYRDSITEPTIDTGNLTLGYNPKTERMVVVRIDQSDPFNKDLGLQPKDELVSWNGADITLENIRDVIADYKKNVKPGDKVTIVVNRKDKKDNYKTKKLKAKAVTTITPQYFVLQPEENPTPEQLKIRKSWINQ